MRNILMSFLAVPALIGIAAAADPRPVRFDTHNGYFVSNKFEPEAATSFLVLQDQKAFDEVFKAVFVMGDKSHRLPPDAFKTKMVVATIHRGKAMWKYEVAGIEAQDRTLIVRYSTTQTPSETASFACPLIVSLDKGEYAAVQFVEDGKTMGKVEVGAATTQPSGSAHSSSISNAEADALRAEIAKVKSENEKLKSALDEAKAQGDALRGRNAVLERAHDLLIAETAKLRARIDDLELARQRR